LENFIAGVFVPPINGEYFNSVNPATNEVIAKIPQSTAADVDAGTDSHYFRCCPKLASTAVSAAKLAFNEWKDTSFTQRAKYLDLIADAIEVCALRKCIFNLKDEIRLVWTNLHQWRVVTPGRQYPWQLESISLGVWLFQNPSYNTLNVFCSCGKLPIFRWAASS
jgi:hypothetical protein